MADWSRKNAGKLSEALHNHGRGAQGQHGALLISLADQVRDAEKRQHIDANSLGQFRSSACKLCREHRLYECDVPCGWSYSCKLIQSNT
jgi:hypothetical protein